MANLVLGRDQVPKRKTDVFSDAVRSRRLIVRKVGLALPERVQTSRFRSGIGDLQENAGVAHGRFLAPANQIVSAQVFSYPGYVMRFRPSELAV